MKHFIFVLIAVSLFACDTPGIDEDTSGKTVTISRDASGEITRKYINEYDADTKALRMLEIDSKGKVKSHYFAKSNENDDVIETIWYKNRTDVGQRTVSSYDENGLYVSTVMYNEFDVAIEKDEVLYRKGKETRTGVYAGDGRLKYTIHEEHDREKRIKKIKHIDPEGKVFTTRTNKYNKEGREIFRSYSFSNGRYGSRITEYDSQGQIKKSEMYRNGKLESQAILESQYDALGRMIKIMYVQNDQPPVYVTRVYTDRSEKNFTSESRDKNGKLLSSSETFFITD